MDRFNGLDLTASERAELPGAEILRAWDEFQEFGDVPTLLYPSVPAQVLNLIGSYAMSLTTRHLDFTFLFEWTRELWDCLLEQDQFVGYEPEATMQSWVQALRHACLALGNLEPKHQKDWFKIADLWDLFIDTWKSVKHPLHYDAFDLAHCRAKHLPVTLNRAKFGVRWSEEREFVASIGYHLQKARPNEDISLPTNTVGQIFGREGECARQYGSRIIKPLRELELLRLMRKYVVNDKANQYRFQANRLDLYTPPDLDVTEE